MQTATYGNVQIQFYFIVCCGRNNQLHFYIVQKVAELTLRDVIDLTSNAKVHIGNTISTYASKSNLTQEKLSLSY
jgi:hypothetical protein